MDNLGVFWRNQFGYAHGVAFVTAFYRHVVAANGGRAILEFEPSHGHSMYVACLWSHRTEPRKKELFSFALNTYEPPEEVLSTGHDRCIIPLKRENVDAWLDPDPHDLDLLYDILEDRDRSYYAHRVAA